MHAGHRKRAPGHRAPPKWAVSLLSASPSMLANILQLHGSTYVVNNLNISIKKEFNFIRDLEHIKILKQKKKSVLHISTFILFSYSHDFKNNIQIATVVKEITRWQFYFKNFISRGSTNQSWLSFFFI